MNTQTVTFQLPKNIYERVRNAAQIQRRPLETLLSDAVSAGLPLLGDLPPELADEMTAMTLLNDHGLHQVLSRKFPASKQRKMDRLIDKKQAGRLNEEEVKELDALIEEAEHFILLRAHTAALLSQRGYKLDPANIAPSVG